MSLRLQNFRSSFGVTHKNNTRTLSKFFSPKFFRAFLPRGSEDTKEHQESVWSPESRVITHDSRLKTHCAPLCPRGFVAQLAAVRRTCRMNVVYYLSPLNS